MRTLGTMLLPRLQPGEPDRDFAQGGRVTGSCCLAASGWVLGRCARQLLVPLQYCAFAAAMKSMLCAMSK